VSGMNGIVKTPQLDSLAAAFKSAAADQRDLANQFSAARNGLDSLGDATQISTYENGPNGKNGFNDLLKYLQDLAGSYDGAANFLSNNASATYSSAESTNGQIGSGTGG
jgi:hypothetical protein